ncbi:viroplasmin family protein [Pseudomonas putida]|uniref:ribonuclease H1 domain-containing protein n=1 Tax=Pseudomonas putida TaxID=303 RepID=UPI002E30F2B6|nr:viroplasmin family protein [Pseudomonas putida]
MFNSWEGGARLSIDRFPEAKHQSFATLALAEEWYRQNPPRQVRTTHRFFTSARKHPSHSRPPPLNSRSWTAWLPRTMSST